MWTLLLPIGRGWCETGAAHWEMSEWRCKYFQHWVHEMHPDRTLCKASDEFMSCNRFCTIYYSTVNSALVGLEIGKGCTCGAKQVVGKHDSKLCSVFSNCVLGLCVYSNLLLFEFRISRCGIPCLVRQNMLHLSECLPCWHDDGCMAVCHDVGDLHFICAWQVSRHRQLWHCQATAAWIGDFIL